MSEEQSVRIAPSASIRVPGGMTRLTGHYFSYLPLSDRSAVANYFEREDASDSDASSAIWFNYRSVAEYNRKRRKQVYGINRVGDKDKSVEERRAINIVTDGGRVQRYRVDRVGAPLTMGELVDVYSGRSDVPTSTHVHLSRSVYVMSPLNAEKRGEQHFMRVLEDGTFVKLCTDTDDRLDRLRQCIKIVRRMERKSSVESARRFNEVCRGVLKRLYDQLNDAKRASTEASALIRILRETYDYAAMTVVYREDNDARGERQKIGNSKLSACKCVVGGCKMFPSLDERQKGLSDESEMIALFKQHVEYNGRRVFEREDEERLPDLSYNFCKKHGRLVVCAWYLLNQQKIWADDFYRELAMHNQGKIVLFNNNAEALHQFFLRSEDVLNRYKRRAESAIMYVEHFIATMRAGMSAVEARKRI